MARKRKGDTVQWLQPAEQRAWLAYVRVQLRLTYEMNRQLQADSDLSLQDYDVLTALSVAPGHRLRISALSAHLGWERSRLSHHARRMAGRSLVSLDLAADDRRATEITLAPFGRRALEDAAPGHVALVRRLFFGGLEPDQVLPLAEALESVHATLLEHGTLPRPPAL